MDFEVFDRYTCFGEIVEDPIRRCPEREAIIFGDWHITYGDFGRMIRQTAHYLRRLGVTKGTRVAIISRNCPECLIAEFALYRLGAVAVKINWRLTPEEMAYIVSQAMEMTDETPEKVLTAAAWLHCNFEYIHPFADGNGRAGRTVMNYYLMLRDLPPVIIFEEDRKLYYEALAVFDASEKVDGMVSFLKDELVKTWSAERRSPATGKVKRMLLL